MRNPRDGQTFLDSSRLHSRGTEGLSLRSTLARQKGTYHDRCCEHHAVHAPDRNLALELVRVTEAGAMAAGRWVGRGGEEGGDGAAVDAVVQLVSSVSMRGVVVIGEGEKDEAPMLYNGEEVKATGLHPDCDFAVDPVDGTTLMAPGMPNADLSVLAIAERGAMSDPSAVFYMDDLAVGPDAADAINITAPVSENLRRLAQAEDCWVSDLTVCILDRPSPRRVRVRRSGRPAPGSG